jgi:hypothetical protein
MSAGRDDGDARGDGDRSAAPGPDDPPARRDLDDGLRFVHVLGMQTKLDGADGRARLEALIDALVARGVIAPEELEARLARTREAEGQRQAAQAAVQVAPTVDKYALTDLPVIDCADRIPLCKARCCRLSFPLSFQDLDEGVVRWNYHRPYQIRQRADGYCVHNDAASHRCDVHAHRPAVCRTYDCRTDPRIWVDFEQRIPAPDDAILIRLRRKDEPPPQR